MADSIEAHHANGPEANIHAALQRSHFVIDDQHNQREVSTEAIQDV